MAYEEEALRRNSVVRARREPLISCSSEATGAATAFAEYAANQSGADGFKVKTDLIESSIDSSLRASHSAQNDEKIISQCALNNATNNTPLLVIAPTLLIELESIFSSISKLLQNGWKIIFRPHPGFIDKDCERFAEQISQWQKEGDFSVDKSRIYFREYFLSCVGILTDGSSMGGSFPLVSGKAAIRFLKSKQHIKHEIYGIKWANPLYNIAVFSNDELLNALMFLNNKEVQVKFSQNIKKFRDEQIYNLGKSAEFIADFMLKI